LFEKIGPIPSPEYFKEQYPATPAIREVKAQRDQVLRNILTGRDDRFLLVIGPCSADNADAVCEYVQRLAKVQEAVRERIFIVPRIYTNKPRTNGRGYKGLLHQPDPEGAPDISRGIIATRKLHLRAIQESHLTAADEMLYPENAVFLNDLLSYHSVGARSVENQQHRLAASGLDAPVGMKNPTGGDLTIMFNSIVAAQASHTFLFRQDEVRTGGNPLAHAILRGSVNHHGESMPNYHYEFLMQALEMYRQWGLQNPALLVDLNHANSNKQFAEQPRIAREILYSRNYNSDLKQIIKGFMIESYLEEGAQSVSGHVYGKSITDPCLGWADSERLIHQLAEAL